MIPHIRWDEEVVTTYLKKGGATVIAPFLTDCDFVCIVREVNEVAALVAVKPPLGSTHGVQDQSAVAFRARTHSLLDHGVSTGRVRAQCARHSSLATPFTWFPLGESHSTKQFLCPLEWRVVVTVRAQWVWFSIRPRKREKHQLEVVKRACNLLVQLQLKY